MSRRRFIVLLPALVAPPAGAHAFLDHADPAVGATVAAAPRIIRLWFTEEVEPRFSTIVLADPDGRVVPASPVAAAPADRSELDLPLAGDLAPGLYKVTWRVVSADTHRTEGHFTFEVAR